MNAAICSGSYDGVIIQAGDFGVYQIGEPGTEESDPVDVGKPWNMVEENRETTDFSRLFIKAKPVSLVQLQKLFRVVEGLLSLQA